MTALYEIRADYDASSIVVYQAYNDEIADAAIQAGRFVAPFSFNRMTWIKPSFRWLMHRSNWGQKRGQERTLRVRITRDGWDQALSFGVLTSPDGSTYRKPGSWESAFQHAKVHVQWDTERSLTGAPLDHYSIQVGLRTSRPRQRRSTSIRAGRTKDAIRHVPPERVYPTSPEVGRKLLLR